MNKIWSIALFLLFNANLSGQVFEKIQSPFERDIPDCYAIEYNLMRLIPKYHRAEQWDSLGYLVEYYNTNCSVSNHFKHFGLLNAISTGNFQREKYPNIIDLLGHYTDNSNPQITLWDYSPNSRPAYYKAHEEYYDFLQEWAGQELKKPAEDVVANDILKVYAGDDKLFLQDLMSGDYKDDQVQGKFDAKFEELIYGDEIYVDLITGVWIPQGNISRLGVHPVIGAGAGVYRNKMRFGGNISIGFLKAPEPYKVQRDDSIFVDDYYANFNIAAEAYRSLYRDLRNDISFGVGIGYSGITFHIYENTGEYQAENLNSFNFNVGLGYTFYYNYQHYFRLEGRYNFLNYHNGINNNLSGDALEIRLIFGFTDNDSKKEAMSRLK